MDVARIMALRSDGLSFAEIARQVGCSRGAVQHHCSTSIPNTNCAVCGKAMYCRPCRANGRNVCSVACRNKWFSKELHPRWKGGARDKNKARESDRKRRLANKARAVAMCGGKCRECGYDRCLAALDFHHYDPSTKTYTVKDLGHHRWEKIEEEVRKCVLICCRCHRELHWKESNGE